MHKITNIDNSITISILYYLKINNIMHRSFNDEHLKQQNV